MAKKKNYDDLISDSPPGVPYNLVLYLASGARDKDRVKYTSVCLNRFREFTSKHYPQGKKMLIYEWNNNLEQRWNTPSIQHRIGKMSLKQLRPVFIKYYKLCQKHGMLPKEMRIPKTINKFCIKDIGQYSPSQVYAYITHLRHLWEEPYFVYNLMTLMDNYGLNIWSAYVIATRISIYGTGHHILGVYSARMRIESVNVLVAPMFTLRDYFTAPEKSDKRIYKKHLTDGNYPYWNMHKHTCNNHDQKSVPVVQILENVKQFNKLLEMPIKEGMEKVKSDIKVRGNMQTFLKSIGFSSVKDYYEPWWQLVRAKNKGELDYLLKVVKPAINGYIVRNDTRGAACANIHLNVKDAHLERTILKKKNAVLANKEFKSKFDRDKDLVMVVNGRIKRGA